MPEVVSVKPNGFASQIVLLESCFESVKPYSMPRSGGQQELSPDADDRRERAEAQVVRQPFVDAWEGRVEPVVEEHHSAVCERRFGEAEIVMYMGDRVPSVDRKQADRVAGSEEASCLKRSRVKSLHDHTFGPCGVLVDVSAKDRLRSGSGAVNVLLLVVEYIDGDAGFLFSGHVFERNEESPVVDAYLASVASYPAVIVCGGNDGQSPKHGSLQPALDFRVSVGSVVVERGAQFDTRV